MTDFCLIPKWASLLLSGVLFLATLVLITLCVYDLVTGYKKKRLAADFLTATVFFLTLPLVTSLAGADKLKIDIHFPWIVVLLCALFGFSYGIYGILSDYEFSRNGISPVSVKQALDNLNSGICFSDSDGVIVLINYTLGELMYPLLGMYPQTLGQIVSALETVEKTKGNNGDGGFYRFPDSSVWQFGFIPISDGFTQTVANNVTELFEANETIERENEQLKITNEKTARMLEALSDRIRQQETLALKMRVHNDIGSSLIKIQRIISGGADEDMETQLRLLRSAVSFFATEKKAASNNLEEVISGAEELNVKLNFNGEMPLSKQAEDLLALALRECVTNCVRHASGDTVNVSARRDDGLCRISITNNGEKPKGKIIEGGGLSSLRRRVEQAQGEMKVLHFPQFELSLVLKDGEANENV